MRVRDGLRSIELRSCRSTRKVQEIFGRFLFRSAPCAFLLLTCFLSLSYSVEFRSQTLEQCYFQRPRENMSVSYLFFLVQTQINIVVYFFLLYHIRYFALTSRACRRNRCGQFSFYLNRVLVQMSRRNSPC